MAWGPRAASVATYLAAGQHLPYERLSVAMGVLFDAPIGQGTLATIMLRGEARLDEFIERLKGLLSQAPVVSADETSIRVATSSSWIHAISTPGLTFLALDEHRGIDAINNIGVLTRYSGVIMHDGLATYHRSELSGAGHAQCGAHLLRALGSVAGVRLHQPSAAALIGAPRRPPGRHPGRHRWTPRVPVTIATTIRARYHHAANRGPYNLATRMRRDAHEILHLLDNTAIPLPTTPLSVP